MNMLYGQNVVLRAWQESDVPFFHAIRNDVGTQLALAADPRPHTLSDVRAWLEHRSGSREGVFFVIAAATEGEPAGFIELRDMQVRHGHASLGLCLARTARGRGWAAEALTMLEAYGQRVLGLNKIVLQVRHDNTAAVALYERAGYRQAGLLRDHFRCGTGRHDVSIWEKLLCDPPTENTPPWMP